MFQIKNGKIYGKDNFRIGEDGHFIVNPEGEMCICGRRGCLQNYASEDVIIKKAHILYETSSSTFLKHLVEKKDDITMDTVLKAFELGDDGIVKIFSDIMKYLSIVLNNISMLLDDPKIILHSKLFSNPQSIKLLRNSIKQNQFELNSAFTPELVVQPYSEFDGAIAGGFIALRERLLV